MGFDKKQRSYYVVFVTTIFKSFNEAASKEPDTIKQHVTRSKELHEKGLLLMSGAFLDESTENLGTMALCPTKEDAENYIKGDPFLIKGMVADYSIRKWSNMFM